MRAGPTDKRGVVDAPAGEAARSHRRRITARRIVVGLALTIVSLTFLVAALALGLVDKAPGWWRTIDGSDPQVVSLGADLENTIAGEMSRVRAGEASAPGQPPRPWRSDEWTVVIRDDEATAWLSTRFGKWLANRHAALPEQVRQIEVAFGEGQLRIGVGLAVGDEVRVLSAVSRAYLSDDGALWVGPSRLYAGRLPLPTSWIARGKGPDWLPRELREDPGFASTLRVLAGNTPASKVPVFTLGDGRQVRIVQLAVHEGRVEITCRTEAKP